VTDVVEGKVVSPEEFARRYRPRDAVRDGARIAGSDVATVARVFHQGVTHDRTRAVVREIAYIPGGVRAGWKYWRENYTSARYIAQIDAAYAQGDMERAERLTTAMEAERGRRWSRLVDVVKLLVQAVKVFPWLVLAFGAVLLGFGVLLAVGGHDGSLVLAPFRWILAIVAFGLAMFTLTATFLPWAAVGVVVLAFWVAGRRAGETPTWLQTSAELDTDTEIDETTIAQALGALRIPQITAHLKSGAALQFLTPCRVDGRGTHAVIRLPRGVAAVKIARRRVDLATGLHRLAKETWPTTGAEEGILDLWIADKGALAEGAGPYPLLTDGQVDVFKGAPFGKTLRGTPVLAPLLERNTLCGGMPGQGKSASARVIMGGAALDPTAELRIWVPDSNFDFEAFKPRCSRYVMGAEDEKIAEILRDLRELHAEVQERGNLLVRYATPAVTRELASQDIGLHPLFCLLEEAHVAIGHADHGVEIGKLLVDIVKLGRKRGIHLIVSTQAPMKDSLPRDITRNCSNGVAFAVGDHVSNDALLGQGAYAAGHRATELIPGADRGTAVVKGFSGERSEILQVYFISIDRDGSAGDQMTPIIKRSLELIRRRGKGVPGSGRRLPVEERDLLDDVLHLMRDAKRVSAADMARWLRQEAPHYGPYASLTGVGLAEQLNELNVAVSQNKGVWSVYRDRVKEAIDERDDVGE
jgi:S-DNA-T family DNA segregation ATPase FtsK/SpoIIIE